MNPHAPLEDEPGARSVEDVRIRQIRPLISPALLQFDLPADAAVNAFVEKSRRSIADIVHGRDRRLLVVVGPCSIHDADQAIEYARRLRGLAAELGDDLLVVMRVYFEKPRTTVGWKGFINDPYLDGSYHVNEGLRLARRLLLEIARLGVPAATEFLDLLSPQYLSDLISWGAIGARTTESPSHRQLASGLSCAIGFKNGTDGGIQMAADALVACAAPHAFMGVTKMGVAAVFETAGNEDCHVILRGGSRGPNYQAGDIEAACAVLRKAGVRDRVMVDCSHGNSEKQFQRQVAVAEDIATQIEAGERRILGVMIESHLREGRQEQKPGQALERGISITDACIGWEATEPLLRRLAVAVRKGAGRG
ncbi:MAG: 2-keto-3-deoxy-D-arabino-heptulosonate-7-phosphate synthase I alpha [uncultured Ramlibacter sp.]|uniref:Phospho-2-dehydro-3-deoxyheptonate aldolase n=1 Tax=uncultured Ramlibacter sp. TaxID=260755 RepID=A0A6J4QQ76_9BURK|nr:MAG: 2-keto-3-deoxy-D-arabino-heptulosonate-7-phosphate synthase I alpha [uncultured Ramlibacter sp.]